MKRHLITGSIAGILFAIAAGCDSTPKSITPTERGEVILKDYGAEAVVLNIEDYTTVNDNFRFALWTGEKLQLVLMSIPVRGHIGLEQHPDIDQFIRIEDGTARVTMGDSRDVLDYVQTAGKDSVILIPAGKWHDIVNVGDTPLKLYSIYAPAEHPHGTVEKEHDHSHHH